ncbi:MAG TPA: hypothetical protein PLY36_08105 [Spirochaetota bacterium]|nr:hypothetical protein [Spirochaetota bacterium]
MEKKYKVAVALNAVPAIVNIAVLGYGFFHFTGLQFSGYLIGTILGILLSAMWLLQVKKALGTHAIKLLQLTFKGFFIKFIVFVVFIIGVYSLVNFSRTFFAASFFIALFMSAVIELWFYASLIKENN